MNDKQDLLAGCHHDPFAYLGMHPCDDRVVVRAFLPHAESVQVAALGSDILVACERVDDAGLFEAWLERCRGTPGIDSVAFKPKPKL